MQTDDSGSAGTVLDLATVDAALAALVWAQHMLRQIEHRGVTRVGAVTAAADARARELIAIRDALLRQRDDDLRELGRMFEGGD